MQVARLARVVVHHPQLAQPAAPGGVVDPPRHGGVVHRRRLMAADDVRHPAEVALERVVDHAVVRRVAGDPRADEEEPAVSPDPAPRVRQQRFRQAERQRDAARAQPVGLGRGDRLVARRQPEPLAGRLDQLPDPGTDLRLQVLGVGVRRLAAEHAHQHPAPVALEQRDHQRRMAGADHGPHLLVESLGDRRGQRLLVEVVPVEQRQRRRRDGETGVVVEVHRRREEVLPVRQPLARVHLEAERTQQRHLERSQRRVVEQPRHAPLAPGRAHAAPPPLAR